MTVAESQKGHEDQAPVPLHAYGICLLAVFAATRQLVVAAFRCLDISGIMT